MKRILLPVLLLTFLPPVWNECFSQVKNSSPKNFPGLFAGVEWNTLSGLTGVAYERTLWEKKKFAVGLKGLHVFAHENGNMQLLGESFDGSSTFSALMPTAHFFTSAYRKNNGGFFFHSGLGVGWRKHETYGMVFNRTITAFEAGFGYQFDLGPGINLRWTNTVLFAGKGGITLSKLSLGF